MNRSQIRVVAVSSFKIVIFDVAQYVSLGLMEAVIAVFWHPFRFVAAEDALHGTVVPTVASPTHAVFNPIAPKQLSKRQAGVMTALIQNQTGCFLLKFGWVGFSWHDGNLLELVFDRGHIPLQMVRVY